MQQGPSCELMQDKRGGKLRRRSSKQALLLSPDQDDMSEDGGSKSRSESMLDVARGLSASLQNIRRCELIIASNQQVGQQLYTLTCNMMHDCCSSDTQIN